MTPSSNGPIQPAFTSAKTIPVGSVVTEWADCPNCQQSATAVYAGRHGCSRCGWPAPRVKRSL